MLRRWLKAYARWDDRTATRIARWARTNHLAAVLWYLFMMGLLAVLLPTLWFVRAASGAPLGTFVRDTTIATAAVGVCVTIVLALMIRRQRRQLIHERLQAGLCEQCGYDLRESRERCPECGAAVS
jgi:hypothetical protein